MPHAALGEIAHYKDKTHDQRRRRPEVAVGQLNERGHGKSVINAHNQSYVGKQREHGAQPMRSAARRQERAARHMDKGRGKEYT